MLRRTSSCPSLRNSEQPPSAPSLSRWLTPGTFILLGLIWGSSFLWIKIGVDEMDPATLVAYRVSLGALAMLHAHRSSPELFDGLFLQSGSFFMPRFDSQESGFVRYRRIVRFVRATLVPNS